MNNKISKRLVLSFEKFNAEVEAFRTETESGEYATLYEDAFTTRNVKNFKLTASGKLSWTEDGQTNREEMFDEDDAREWLKFWRGCLRKARRYWEMNTETLDAIQEGEREDISDDE